MGYGLREAVCRVVTPFYWFMCMLDRLKRIRILPNADQMLVFLPLRQGTLSVNNTEARDECESQRPLGWEAATPSMKWVLL